MSQLHISTIFEHINDLGIKEEIINSIRNLNPLYKSLLMYTYHDKIIFDLPEGDVPDEFIKFEDVESNGPSIYELKKLDKYFVNSLRYPNLKRSRKELLWVDMLGSIDQKDARLFMSIKNKKLPYENITEEVVIEALPELFLDHNQPKPKTSVPLVNDEIPNAPLGEPNIIKLPNAIPEKSGVMEFSEYDKVKAKIKEAKESGTPYSTYVANKMRKEASMMDKAIKILEKRNA